MIESRDNREERIPGEAETAPSVGGTDPGYRSPGRAAVWSLLVPGGGQIYNKQLEKAVLLWIWMALLTGVGTGLLLLGFLGHVLRESRKSPPLGHWVAEHTGLVVAAWALLAMALWAASVRDAWTSAERINGGEVRVRYGMRRQAVHVLGSQLLGLIPFVGFMFPPGIVAEALDAAHERRRPDRDRLLREGGQALREWAITQAALVGLGLLFLAWAVAWIIRAVAR